ncbi:CocE/NonD family hydrolase [Rhizobium lemnae]|uniref:CocE/NonD family hydrolase n=1 Tax=Rhizobium lemnae TaxID=1214924 RepID=A0ABV8E748_9HYPH|nr:CocE/NonD family hydrolase [Rhizobium lemnae]MCJ8509453.1 CocE/NonD family hydrolase [Rhizobium lemnae]
MLSVQAPQTITMTMADGVGLVADVYRPVGPGRFPVLVLRLPYGRRVASTVVLAHPAWYAAQGYIVVVQDVRGRGTSGGRFRVLEDEAADGAATLTFAADLDCGNGQVATYGFSYHAMNQFLGLAGAIRAGTRRPDAMVTVMAAWNVRNHWAYEGNAFRLADAREWARQMAVENATRDGAYDMAAALLAGFAPKEERLVTPPLLERGAAYSHYRDWVADDPAYWLRLSPNAALDGIIPDLPVLHIGGWHDIMLEGTLAAYRAFSENSTQQRLMIGPWAHIPWGRRSGALDCGAKAAQGVDQEIVGFFDSVLKGHENPLAPVRLYDCGIRDWRNFSALPEAQFATLYLGSGGRACPTSEDGILADRPGHAAVDYIVHDPWRPAPACGLHLGAPYGYAKRSAVDDRGDVAVYTSPPLISTVMLCGATEISLDLSCDQLSFDLHLVLSMVTPDFEVIALASGHWHQPDGAEANIKVALRFTTMTIPAGFRLRLSLQASAFPAFPINPGTGLPPQQAGISDALVTTLSIRTSQAGHCRIRLPLLDAAQLQLTQDTPSPQGRTAQEIH